MAAGLCGKLSATLSGKFQHKATGSDVPLDNKQEPFRIDSLTLLDIIACIEDSATFGNASHLLDLDLEKEEAELTAAARAALIGEEPFMLCCDDTSSENCANVHAHDHDQPCYEAGVALDTSLSYRYKYSSRVTPPPSPQSSRLSSAVQQRQIPDHTTQACVPRHSVDWSCSRGSMEANDADSSYLSPPLLSPSASASVVGCGDTWQRSGGRTRQHPHTHTPTPAPPTPLATQRSLTSLILSDLQDQHNFFSPSMLPIDADVRLLSEAAGVAAADALQTPPNSRSLGNTARGGGQVVGHDAGAGVSISTEAEAFEAFLRSCGSEVPELPIACGDAVAMGEATTLPQQQPRSVPLSPAAVDISSLARSVSLCASDTDGTPLSTPASKRKSMVDALPAADAKRPKSAPGMGTNRPPKQGSVSAQLPAEKLDRKRAAARRYYHNQKNKVVDYEDIVTRLELENAALKGDVQLALEELESLKQARAGMAMQRMQCST